MRKIKFLLMLALLLVGISSVAQTAIEVEFVAGVDKGKNVKVDWKGKAGADQVEKEGVTMKSDNALFAADKYMTKTYIGNKSLTFSATKSIVKIQFVDGEGLSHLTAEGFDDATATWTGKAAEVTFVVKGEVKYAKAIVTLENKSITTLTFDHPQTVAYAEFNDTYSFPVILKDGGIELTSMPIIYESSNPEVATINNKGILTPHSLGATIVTASFAGNDSYEASEAEVTFYVVDGKNIFTETFDKMNGKGGNDDNFGVWGDFVGNLSASQFDNQGWSYTGGSNGTANQCVRVEMSASVTTPALATLSGDAFIFFRAAQNRDVATSINLSVSGGGTLSQKSVSLEKQFNDYVVFIKDATPNTKVTFSCSAWGCYFLDNVKIERAIGLDEATDNSAVLEKNNGKEVNVMLKRTLVADSWNTLCLPFSMSNDAVQTVFGEGTVLKQMKEWNAAENVIYFETADAIVAGQPYIIKPVEAKESFLLQDQMVLNAVNNATSGDISFCGVMGSTKLDESDVFLGTDGELYLPNVAEENGDVLRGFRAYFKGINSIANTKVNIEGMATGIENINGATAYTNGKVYTLAGQYVANSTKGLMKGIYVVNGKKIVVR